MIHLFRLNQFLNGIQSCLNCLEIFHQLGLVGLKTRRRLKEISTQKTFAHRWVAVVENSKEGLCGFWILYILHELEISHRHIVNPHATYRISTRCVRMNLRFLDISRGGSEEWRGRFSIFLHAWCEIRCQRDSLENRCCRRDGIITFRQYQMSWYLAEIATLTPSISSSKVSSSQ